MSNIGGLILILCLIHVAYAGVVPQFVLNAASSMVPDGISNVIYNVPSEEVVAAKRFALEADLAVDPERIELYRNILFQTLLKSANLSQVTNAPVQSQNIQYVPIQPTPPPAPAQPNFIARVLNSALNSAAQSFQPTIKVALQPSIGFGNLQ